MRVRDRTLVLSWAALFVVSTAFPVAAGILNRDAHPTWLGVSDVALASLVLLAGMAISFRKPGRFEGRSVVAAFQIYRGGANLFLVLFVMFFVVGDRIQWSILLPGLAWREWLLAWVLPSALALWDVSSGVTGREAP